MYTGREIADYLDDIRTAIAEVEEFTRDMTFEAFAADKKTINAVIMSLEVLGVGQLWADGAASFFSKGAKLHSCCLVPLSRGMKARK